MISAMREYFRGLKLILLFVIVAFIATSVVYFGASSFSSGGKPNVVATVNGEEIPAERFRRLQASYVQRYERLTRQRMTPEMIERLGVAQQVLDELIREAVIVQGAEREGVRVTDDELRARIQEFREFQVDGRFSRDEYLKVLRSVRLEPGVFEAELRRHLTRLKMESLVREGVKVTDGEVSQVWELRHERVRGAWAHLGVQPLLAQITVAESEVEPYVKARQAQFSRPERRKVQYVVVSPSRFAQPVSDTEAEAYYKEHSAQFQQPRRLRLAHVLVRVPPVGGSEAEQKSRAKVQDVIRRAKAGEDFAKLAREVSEDPANAAQGGDLGFVAPGDLVPAFEQAAFALKKGEVSPEPVRTPFGYHAIKVLDVKDGGLIPFKEAAPRIKEALLNEKSDRAARARADEVRAPLVSAKDFAAEARKLGLEVKEATVGRGDGLEGVGRDPGLEDALFELAVGGVSSPVKTAGGYVIAKVLDRIQAGVPPLGEIKAQVMEAIRMERAEAMALDRAKALLAALARGSDFAATARAEGFAVGDLPMFSRAEPPKDRAALPSSVLLAALQTPAGQVSEPVKTPAGVYVVKTLERQRPAGEGFEKERETLGKQLLDQKRNLAWEGWVRARMLASKVEVGGQTLPLAVR